MTSSEEEPRDSHEGLSEDPIVGRLVPDSSQPPPPTVALEGLLGRSIREGYWRLYFSSGLERYAEFKEEDVLHSEKIPQEQLPFAGLQATKVWLRHDAEVEYARTESRRMQAEFLQGGLAAGRSGLARSGAQVLPGPTPAFAPSWRHCLTYGTECRTVRYTECRCFSGALLCTLPGYPGCHAAGISRFCQPV
jgi:hypothetical protein